VAPKLLSPFELLMQEVEHTEEGMAKLEDELQSLPRWRLRRRSDAERRLRRRSERCAAIKELLESEQQPGTVHSRVAASDTKGLIAKVLDDLANEVPALSPLRLVMKVELPTHGGDAPIWRVELPGPKIHRDPAADARIQVEVQRPKFNELAEGGRLSHWVRAHERGYVKVTGDPGVTKLLGKVIARQRARDRA
jgi:hypothetical protein